MKVLIAERREPVHNAIGVLIGYRSIKDYVERPDLPAPQPWTPAAAPAPRRVTTTQAAPALRTMAPAPRPASGFRLEFFAAPDTLAEVVKCQQARREGTPYRVPQGEAPAPAASWYTPAPDTFAEVVKLQRARGLR